MSQRCTRLLIKHENSADSDGTVLKNSQNVHGRPVCRKPLTFEGPGRSNQATQEILEHHVLGMVNIAKVKVIDNIKGGKCFKTVYDNERNVR